MFERKLTFPLSKLSRSHRRSDWINPIWMIFMLMIICRIIFSSMSDFEKQPPLREFLHSYNKTLPHQADITAMYDLPSNSLSFTSTVNETFRIPTDINYLAKWGCADQYFRETEEAEIATYGKFAYFFRKRAKVLTDGKFVRYLREVADIAARGKLGKCTPALDVVGWLMDKINAKNGTLMIQAGGLIHIHREKEFISKKTGKYIDDDIDLWASLETVVHIGQLEPELFSRFGWTIRAWINSDDYLVFMNIIASCEHTPKAIPNFIKSSQPGIEIYPLAVIAINGTPIVKDLWQGTQLPESMVFPPQHIRFNSTGASEPLHLQLPHKALDVLACMYGNWTVPSKEHAEVAILC